MNRNSDCASSSGAPPRGDFAGADMAAQHMIFREIIDDLDYGIVVLDAERKVQFVNRAFRRFWRLSDHFTAGPQTFISLMYHCRGTSSYAVSHDRLGDYVAKQQDLIRSGEQRPLNIQLSDGEVFQFRCKALSNGRRLLTYSKVSELVQQAESLQQLASLDAMTGLNNRRRFLELAEVEWYRFQRYGRPLAMLMIDIDLFKSVNDTYGHDAGDEVIKAVAEILQRQKRASDIAGRLGGEEFALVLPEATVDGAVVVAERLRQLVGARMVPVGSQRIPITISVGASLGEPGMKGLQELLKQADLALYEAKRSGRNRVCLFAADATFGPPQPSLSHGERRDDGERESDGEKTEPIGLVAQ